MRQAAISPAANRQRHLPVLTSSICVSTLLPVFALSLVALIANLLAAAERLVDRPPFDQLQLDEANHHAVLQVAPLDLPNRKMPAQPIGNLTVELLSRPGESFEVPWENIASIRFYEQGLLEEAQRLTADGKYDEAFDYYAKLAANYSSFPGVNDAVNDYLRRNALALYQAQNFDRALAVLASLYDRAPNSTGLASAVDAVCGRVIEQHLREQDYAAARAVLEMWRNQFRALNSPAIAVWEQRFATAAQREIVEGRKLMADRQYVAARKRIGKARDIWPDSPEARDLLAEIQRRNPSISVGVFEASPSHAVRRLDDWAAMRASRLAQPTLSELVDFSSEGGVYASPYGRWVPDDSGLRLSLQLNPTTLADAGSRPTADVLARFLLGMADPARPEYRADFASRLAGVSVEGDEWVHIDWSRPHVRPEALFQVPIVPPDASELPAGDSKQPSPPSWTGSRYSSVEAEPGSMTFAATPLATSTGATLPGDPLPTIIEQTMSDDDAAVAALLHGEIDVLDRVPPWQLERLRATQGIQVGTYRLPTVHVLVPNMKRPLLASREFRRALCYGIQRDRVVQEVLLGGAKMPGFDVLSGPFPTGLSVSDPLRYAYNNQLGPRPFEPRLAAVLSTVGWSETLDPEHKGNAEAKEMPELVLAYPGDPVARIACETIKLQLGRAQIPVRLLEFTADQLEQGKVDCDLRYAELAVWEPVVDARTLLGPTGLAGDVGSSYLYAALRQLDEATNWKDVRSRLSEIHEIAHHDLPLIPLWQTVNYFAYRTDVHGIGDSPVALYQNVEHWELGSSAPVATGAAKP
jgi:ABC-type transport system substrate-binding protein/tetratricopeptide (TPR) repeat protein